MTAVWGLNRSPKAKETSPVPAPSSRTRDRGRLVKRVLMKGWLCWRYWMRRKEPPQMTPAWPREAFCVKESVKVQGGQERVSVLSEHSYISSY